MRTLRWAGVVLLGATLALAAAPPEASTEASPSEVPQAVKVPPGYQRGMALQAHGVQIYRAVEGKSGLLAWELQGPLADLVDDKGNLRGRHYDGPTWEAQDGSLLVRDRDEAVKQAPARDPTAIPWLLVKVKSDAKPGTFAGVVYVQRLNTVGGIAPTELPKRVGTKIGIPYRAEYHLWLNQ